MFSDIINTDGNELIKFRLDQLQIDLRGLSLPTKIELQAAVIGRLNKILALGNTVSPLIEAGADGPAVVGDITQNLMLLNGDALGIAAVLNALEQDAAKLFNLTAATQNTLRQQVREQVYGATVIGQATVKNGSTLGLNLFCKCQDYITEPRDRDALAEVTSPPGGSSSSAYGNSVII
jgi:hypothetical protein